MTVREIISELLKYKNLDAELNLKVNEVDYDNEAFDRDELQLEFWGQDKEQSSSYDLFIYDKAKKNDDSVHKLLDEYGEITIRLSNKDGKENIVILDDETRGVLREIDVDGRFDQTDNVVKILQSIL